MANKICYTLAVGCKKKKSIITPMFSFLANRREFSVTEKGKVMRGEGFGKKGRSSVLDPWTSMW